jgi:methionine--tRNA ligase beta chain
MTISINDFRKVELKVAEIVSAQEHPNADKLYVLQVAVGSETKQIVAGIRLQYSISELVGRKVVIVNNLEPVILRGEESRGMLLAASVDGLPVIITPEKDVPSASPVQ